MKCLTFVTFMLFISTNLAAETLSSRIRDAASSSENAEQIISTLQAKVSENLNTEDYLVLSESHQTLRQREAALDNAFKAEANAPDAYLKALSLLQKAQIYGILFQDVEKALQELAAAEQHLLPLTDNDARLLMVDVFDNLASAHNVAGDVNQALAYAKRSLQLAEELKSLPQQLTGHIQVARLAAQKNQYKLAFNHLQQALLLTSEFNDEERIASIHYNMGRVYRKLDQHSAALTHFDQAAERYKQLNNIPTYTNVLVFMAETYMEEPRQLDKAETLLLEARELSEELQHKRNMAVVSYSLGRVALLRKNYAESERYYQQALQLYTESSVGIMVQETTLAIITLYIEQQRYQDATELQNTLTPAMENAALFLKFRYATNAADLAVAAGDWQRAYEAQKELTELKQEQLTEQIQENLTGLTEDLQERNTTEQQDQQLAEVKQALAAAESRQVLLYSLMVVLIFIAFIIWQLYRRQQVQTKSSALPELTPRQWDEFREKVKVLDQHQPQSLLVIMPRQRAALQRQFGRRIITDLLKQLSQELDTEAVKASFSGSEMLWLAVASQDKAAQSVLLEQAMQSFSSKLLALGVEPAILTAELELAPLLGPNWHKRDLNGLTDILWFGWSLLEQSPPADLAWRLSFTTEHARPCEWQVEDFRTDIVNAYRLGELTILVNQHALTPEQAD